MRSFSPIVLFFLLCTVGCQKKQPDTWSAKKIWAMHKTVDSLPEDSSYVVLKHIEKELERTPYDDSLSLANDYLLGKHFNLKNQLDSSAFYYQRTLDKVQDPLDYATASKYFYKAQEPYYYLGKFGDCIAIGEKLLNRLDSTAYQEQALAYIILADAHWRMGNRDEALRYNKKQIEVLKKAQDESIIFTSLVGLADKLYGQGKREASFELLDSLIAVEANIPVMVKYQVYGNYGVYQFFEGDFNQSKKYYQEGLEIKKLLKNQLDQTQLLATSYSNLAEVCIELNELDEARKYLDTLKQLGLHNISRRIRKAVLRYELKWANATNSPLTSLYDHLDTISKYQELTYNYKVSNELVELKNANEKEKVLLLEKQEADIQNLKLQTRSIILLISIGLLSVIGFLFYQSRRLKFEKQSLQNQQRLLRSQMNPHFTFNTLYAIKNQIKNTPEAATDYLLKFSRLLRLYLENSMGDYIAIEKEIESLKKYMDLQKLRSHHPFEYQFHFEGMDEDELLFIPPMLLQPFVENAIEHGFSNIDYAGKIDIHFKLMEKLIQCTIKDNGKGFTTTKNSDKKSASTQLISDFLKKSTGKEVQVKANENGGTEILFHIPYALTEEG